MLTSTPGNILQVTIINSDLISIFHLWHTIQTPRFTIPALKVCVTLQCTKSCPIIWIVDFRLHVFDTTATPAPNARQGLRRLAMYSSDAGLKTNMKVMKTIQGNPGRWTITDANLSPDNQRLGMFFFIISSS